MPRLLARFAPAAVLRAGLISLLLSCAPYAAATTVLSSIQPLQLIAQSVLGEHGEAQVLLPAGASPHQYTLRPSDMRAVQAADLLFWVGPELESFLPKVLERRSKPSTALLHVQGMRLKHFAEAKAEEDHHEHDHSHDSLDPHFWLDPHNAQQIAAVMAEQLSNLDPANAAAYQANAARFSQALKAADAQLRERLAKLKNKPYLVFHQGYDYFEAHMGLKAQGVFVFTPEVQPGARHLHELRQRLKAVGAACIFSEPPQVPRTLHSLGEDLPVRFGQLDPLGQDSANFVALYQNLGSELASCLEQL